MNNTLTASRMTSFLKCPRSHFWTFELGMRKEVSSIALRIGSAWANAMEARWNGADYDQALTAAIPAGIKLDAVSCHTVAALLAGYYDQYGEKEDSGEAFPEVQFSIPIEGTPFHADGKLDVLRQLSDGRTGIVEAKTTGDSVAPESDFWMRLNFNIQVWQYVSAARAHGWDVNEVIYDVTRKPTIRPRNIIDLDDKGRKIVLDLRRKRVFKPDGITPVESGSKRKGWTVKSHRETPEEYSDRVYQDTKVRPEFYFARRAVPVIDQEVEEFERQRLAIAGAILNYRSMEREDGAKAFTVLSSGERRDPSAWPRACNENNCNFCTAKSFCLSNVTPDVNNPPEGFSFLQFNTELQKKDELDDNDTQADTLNDASSSD